MSCAYDVQQMQDDVTRGFEHNVLFQIRSLVRPLFLKASIIIQVIVAGSGKLRHI